MNEPHFTVRRIDQSFRVQITIDGLEHTHRQGHREANAAWNLLRQIRYGLRQGIDLNLEYWDTVPV